jgi:Kyakuja-Dileera-Zisupton transposase
VSDIPFYADVFPKWIGFGHRQMNMDYSFCEAMKHSNMDGIDRAILLYDVNCQFSKKFYRRVSENPYLSVPEGIDIDWSIGLFHVHGHQDACLARYAPSFLRGAGRFDGEIVETLWPGINEVSPSARGATLAYRAELLDAHMNDSNRKKLLNIRKSSLCFIVLPVIIHTRDRIHTLQEV